MRKNTCILIILLIYTSCLFGQNSSDSLLLSIEKQIYSSNNDSVKTNLLLKKLNIYFIKKESSDLVLSEIERLDVSFIADSFEAKKYLWNASLMHLLQKKYWKASHFLNQYQSYQTNDTSLNVELFKAIIFMNTDSSKLTEHIQKIEIKDSLFHALMCYNSLINYKKKSKNSYLISSAFIPGSGMLALKKPQQAITSFILNTASLYAIYSLAQNNLYLNAVTWGLTLGQKFYGGGLKLTEKIFTDTENKFRYQLSCHCEEGLNTLLNKYPLDFKLK